MFIFVQLNRKNQANQKKATTDDHYLVRYYKHDKYSQRKNKIYTVSILNMLQNCGLNVIKKLQKYMYKKKLKIAVGLIISQVIITFYNKKQE